MKESGSGEDEFGEKMAPLQILCIVRFFKDCTASALLACELLVRETDCWVFFSFLFYCHAKEDNT